MVTAGGDTVRGQLHKESYFGRIRDPESGEKKSVLRKELNSQNFKTESALAAIVDPAIREAVSAQLRLRMSSGKSFKEAMDEGGFRMRSGDDVFQGPPIRKVRSFVENPETRLCIRSGIQKLHLCRYGQRRQFQSGALPGASGKTLLLSAIALELGERT